MAIYGELMIKELGPGFRLTLIFTVLTGLLYPAVMTGISEIIFPRQANGSLVTVDGKVVASSLIGQNFSRPEYFHPRPSAAGSGYDATASGGSNLGPTSAKLLRGTTKMDDRKNEVVDFDGISLRIVHYCIDNDIPYESTIPLDRFKDAKGDLDEVKLIKAFNDDRAPLTFTAAYSFGEHLRRLAHTRGIAEKNLEPPPFLAPLFLFDLFEQPLRIAPKL